MLLEGVNLMVVGMTAVFSFLTLLVVMLQISARVFESFGDRWPDAAAAPVPVARGDVEVAVVLAAIEAHRRESR